MSTKIAKTPAQTAMMIVEALAGGLSKAAQIYKEFVDAGGDVVALRQSAPVSADLWRTLDDVATGRIDVRVLCLPPKAANAIRLLPPTMQKNVIETGVEVLTSDGTSIKVPVAEVTAKQAEQVFYKHGVRAVSQQAAWLKATKPSAELPRPAVPYEVKAGKLRVYEPVELTASDLHRILGILG